MNNIYKVIWSKAKNCYVVASEIARSHTKSASGSEKIGGVARHALLALGAACAIACGGFVNVGAADTVDVTTGGSTATVYTKEGTEFYVAGKIRYLTEHGDVFTNKDNIAKNKADINALQSELGNKADATALGTKADKTYVDTELTKKADNDTVIALEGRVGGVEGKVTALETTVGDASSGLVKDVATLKTTVGDASSGLVKDVNDLNTELGTKAKQSDLEDATKRITVNEGNITALQTKTQKIDYDAANGITSVNGMKVGQQVDMNGKNLTDVGTINGIDLGTKQKGNYISQDGSIWGNMMQVDDQVKTNADAIAQEVTNRDAAVTNAKKELEDKIQTNADNIKNNKDEIARVNGELVKTNDYFNAELGKTNGYFNKELSKTNNHFNTELGKTNAALQAEGKVRAEADAKINTKIGNIDDTRTAYVKDANSISQNLTTLDEKLQNTNDRTGGIKRNTEDTQTTIEDRVKVDNQGNVKDVKNLGAETITTTGNATIGGTLGVNGATTLGGTLTAKDDAKFEKNVTVDKDLTVNGKLNVDEISMKNDGLDPNGDQHHSATTITADGISNNAKVTDKNGVTTESKFTHDKEGSTTYAYKGDAADWKESTSNVTAGGVENVAKDSKDNNNTFTQTSTDTKNILKDKDGNTSTTRQDSKGIYGYAKDKDGNKSYTKQEGNRIAESVIGQDGKETKSEMTSTDITNTAKDGTITNDAKDIVNNATGDMTNNVGGNLSTTVGGNEIHEVKGTKTETVEGKVTENFKNGQETNVTGNQDIHVTGKQTNTVGGGQENIISGGQINNITGDQTTTISGTQTTTATDINRNASSSMVDKVDNAYGTNTETKEAGKTTTDVSIKGTGEKGQYIRGANESRDYLIKGTLKNEETKTVDATSTEITDGTNKASTIQKVTDLAGSVTNGKETGVSGIHANKDGSVSIDSAVAGGGMSSVINQKKDSIQSAVGDGTNSTVILQDKDNVTIASSNGMVGLVGKDIVNNAQDTITNTAGTSITNQVNDSKVTTDANGTTFENNTPAVSDGGATTTKINGNQITTGRVDANELGVSDKDGTNTADLSVKAGEGVKASASDGTTTGSLDVTADEVGSTVKDASGKGSTFKQRIDAIMMESKNVSIKAEETLTNEAKVITNKASEVINNEAININNTATGIIKSKASEIQNQADRLISNKVGENTWENMEDGKITTSIKNGTKQNLTQSDAEKTEHSVVNGSNSTVNKQTSEEITDAVTNGTTTNMTQNTATSSNNTIADKNGNANTVISTADGTSFINSKAAAPVTGASGAGTHLNTTIKGNTITTGKVTMDYADVMKDLGVHGNAKIDGKTTTDSLEVTGTSTLKGNVTMESDATVNGNFSVGGNTNLKNTEVDGTLNVTQKATFGDSVSIAKDLSVGGDVTANSYKVGGNTYIDANGINANDQKITNVADGSISEGSKDAVNGGQLYDVKRDMEHKVDKVGANAAAMANLRPMEFDPSSKWNIAAAIGNYGSETAAALGAFYRPNDDVMVNLSTAFGTGENMVGGGVSVRLGKGSNKLSREENNALKAQVADLTARMDALLSVLNPNMSKDFPDVPENHWAYEAVSRLAGNDIVQGYPDGEFHGERTMTRYEMAEIIYNALSRGAEAEKELVEEFKPELQAMAASEKATAERAEG